MNIQLAVIGGGPGGYAAAFLAADLGIEVALIEQEPKLGGVCLLRGCIPSKALLHVAKSMAEARHLADWGVGFAPPKIDIQLMRDRKDKTLANLSNGLKQLSAKRKVQIIQAKACFQDSRTLKLLGVNGKSPPEDLLQFNHCIIATGSSPAIIPALNLPTPRIMDSTAALDLPDVPESLLVVGGGYIGLEMGTVYAALGSKVTVVELTDGLLPGADRDLVKPLHKKLEIQFEAIYLNSKVAGLKDLQNQIEVAFEGNVEQKTQSFSRVLISVGRGPIARDWDWKRPRSMLRRRALSWSMSAAARTIRTFLPSATWPANRCWPIRPPTKVKRPWNRSSANRPCFNLERYRPWSLPIRKSLGPD